MANHLRCAIYTRKSSEEGLEQDFNSLHAQREACEAYVRSQVGEGWQAISTAYDDGGFSGGSLERPGLKRLLGDVAAGKTDVVVVYKVDRLTRSLADFAKIVENFDARGVSFVSVTQAFNTTTSMGRLTLNVLLSFAQFEREVTGERIRDKIAASKKKGMWMGGVPPLGYDVPTDPRSRALVTNQAESEIVRHIFKQYLEVASAKTLVRELDVAGIRSKAWVTRDGRQMGGAPLGRGAIFHILSSRIYLGEIVHRDIVYPGLHEPIISRALFDVVAERLASGAAIVRDRPVRAASAPLKGIIFDALGQPMSPSFAYGRGGRPYRYYIAMALQVGVDRNLGNGAIRRVSGPAVDAFLVEELRRLSDRFDIETSDLRRLLRRVELREAEIHLVVNVGELFRDQHPELALSALKRRLKTDEQAVVEGGAASAFRIVLAQRLQLRGGRTRILGCDDERRGQIDQGLVTALKRAHAELADVNSSPLADSRDLVNATAPSTRYERQLGRLAFLAPDLQRQILNGEQPVGFHLRQALRGDMPLAWVDQRKWFATIASA